MSTSTAGVSAQNFKRNLGNSASLLEAIDAASNWPAFILLSATWIVAMLSTAVFGAVTAYLASQSGAAGMLSGLVTFLVVTSVVVVGINATGIMLSDSLWGRKQRGIIDAILASAFSVHRLLAVVIIEFLLFVGFLVVLTLALFLCKIPGIGPLLYAVVFPAGVILTGLVIFSLAYIGLPLAAPAVWNGSSVKHTLLLLQAVARKRLLTAIIMMVLMTVLIFAVVSFVWMILLAGTGTVFSLSAGVLGITGGGMGRIMTMFMGAGGAGSGYVYAMGFGGAILALVGANPGFLIGLKGSSIIYREVSVGLSLDEDEIEMDRHMQSIKARADQARQQVAAAAQQAKKAASAAEAPKVAEASIAPVEVMSCPNCHNPVSAADVFCGNCGHKLQ